MKTEIRTFLPGDITQIVDMENELFSDPWSKELLMQSCCIDYCWVIEGENDSLIGYLIGQLILDEFSIYNIAVKKEHQGKGLGKMLLKFLLEYLNQKNCVKIFLEVRSQNRAAIGLYSSFGFNAVHIRKNYYHNPDDDAILMVYDMNEKDIDHEEV